MVARVVFVSVLVVCGSALGQAPDFVTYSGRLTDGTGAGQSTVTALMFRLYGSSDGDDVLWQREYPSVLVEDGYFNVLLGGGDNPATPGVETDYNVTQVFAQHDRTWMAVCAGEGCTEPGAAFLPRQAMGAVPYAATAGAISGGAVVEGDLEVKGDLTVGGRLKVGGRVVGSCPSDMVLVGDFCVDRYESSLWSRKDGEAVDCEALQAAVDEALANGWTEAEVYDGFKAEDCDAPVLAMCNYKQYGSQPGCNTHNGCDDYPAEFPDSGNWTKPLYACAIEGVMPSRSMTWFQAAQACVNSGRHLVTNGEWQAAVAGTPDTTACNTASSGPWKTGQGTCTSATGVEDMIGNLWEWVDLWGQAGPVNTSYSAGTKATPWPASYGDGGDGNWNINGQASTNTTGWTTGLPFAALRGGNWDNGSGAGAFAFTALFGPSSWGWSLGLRCASGL